jgi:hypothetical protein
MSSSSPQLEAASSSSSSVGHRPTAAAVNNTSDSNKSRSLWYNAVAQMASRYSLVISPHVNSRSSVFTLIAEYDHLLVALTKSAEALRNEFDTLIQRNLPPPSSTLQTAMPLPM